MSKLRWAVGILTIIFLFQEVLVPVASARVRVVKVKKTRHEKRQTPQQGYSDGDENYNSPGSILRPEDNPYNAGNRQVDYPLNNANNHPDNKHNDQSQFDQDSNQNIPFNNNQNQHISRRQSSSGAKTKSYDEEHCDGCGNGIPGDPGTDYPIFAALPKTSFDCKKQQWPGYYADVDSRCQVFWICQKNRADAFLCPNGTLFNQQVFVCDWWFNVDCGSVTEYYSRNQYIYGGPGIDLFGNQIQIKAQDVIVPPPRNVINNSNNVNRRRTPTNRPPFQNDAIEQALTTVTPFTSNQRPNNFQTSIPIIQTTQETYIKTASSQGGSSHNNRRATDNLTRRNTNNNSYASTNKQIGSPNSNSGGYNGNAGTYSTSTNQQPKNVDPRVANSQSETSVGGYSSRNSNQGGYTQSVRNQGDYDRTTISSRDVGGYANNQPNSQNNNFGTNYQQHSANSGGYTDRNGQNFERKSTRTVHTPPSTQTLQLPLLGGTNSASVVNNNQNVVTDGGNSYANYIDAQKRLHLGNNYKPNPSTQSYNQNPLLTQGSSTTSGSNPAVHQNSRTQDNFNAPQIRHPKNSDFSIKHSQYFAPPQPENYRPYSNNNNGGYSTSNSGGYTNNGGYSTTTKRNALSHDDLENGSKIGREESLDALDDELEFSFAKTLVPTVAKSSVKVTSFDVKDNRPTELDIHGTVAPRLPDYEVTTARLPTRNSLKSPRRAALGVLEKSHHSLQQLPQNPVETQTPVPAFGKKIKSGRKRNSSHWTTPFTLKN